MKRNYLNLSIAAAFFLLFVLACGGGTSTPPKQPTVIAFGDICKPENHDKDITIEGFVWTTKSVNCKRTARTTRLCNVELYETAEHKGKPVTVRFREGDGASEMALLPEKFTQNDIKLKTAGGEIVGATEKVRLTGYAETKGDSDNMKEFGCYINVKKIEKP